MRDTSGSWPWPLPLAVGFPSPQLRLASPRFASLRLTALRPHGLCRLRWARLSMRCLPDACLHGAARRDFLGPGPALLDVP